MRSVVDPQIGVNIVSTCTIAHFQIIVAFFDNYNKEKVIVTNETWFELNAFGVHGSSEEK